MKKIDFENKKLYYILGCIFLFLLIILLSILLIGKNKSSIKLISVENEEGINLISKNSFAKKGFIKEGNTAIFEFSDEHKKMFKEIYDKNKSSALVLRVELTASDELKEFTLTDTKLPFNYGFITNENYSEKNKLIEDFSKNISVFADLNSFYDDTIMLDLSLALPYTDDISTVIPRGFFVSSSFECKIVSVCVSPCMIGFDKSMEPYTFYGFASNGGVVDSQCKTFDFTGTSLVFKTDKNTNFIMPEYSLKFYENPEYKSTIDSSVKININAGGDRLNVKNVQGVDQLRLPSSGLKNPYPFMDITTNHHCLSSILLKNVDYSSSDFEKINTDIDNYSYVPIKTDPGVILNYPTSNWRVKEYEVFEWDRYPNILFFDTLDYKIQEKFFRRLAFFVEKAGYKGKILSNDELEGKHGYNAHDYSSKSLADFFNKSYELNVELNEEELVLKNILILNGILIPDGQNVKPNKGGIVSISRESLPGNRATFLAHEGFHTLFFDYEDFRNCVAAVYHTMDPISMEFLIDYFKSQPNLGYDTSDQFLMYNEFMAYILQNPLSNVGKYFAHHANRYSVRVFTPVLAEYVRNNNGRGFEDAAIILNDYVFDTFGVISGNISLIQR